MHLKKWSVGQAISQNIHTFVSTTFLFIIYIFILYILKLLNHLTTNAKSLILCGFCVLVFGQMVLTGQGQNLDRFLPFS